MMVPQIDLEVMNDGERAGVARFVQAVPLNVCKTDDERRGWWLTWARCYGQGVKAYCENPWAANPYLRLGAAWEAWGQGYEETSKL